MPEINLYINKENIPSFTERVRLSGKLARVAAGVAVGAACTDVPHLIALSLKAGFTDESMGERSIQMKDKMSVKMAKYVISKDIGTEAYRLNTNDDLQQVKERRGLPSSTLITQM